MKNTKLIAGVMALALSGGVIFCPDTYAESQAYSKTAFTERVWTDEETADITALAKMLWGEARGVKSTTERAACCWVVFNRVDDKRWSDNTVKVLSQRLQFSGYSASNPVDDELYSLAEDVYSRWLDEKSGEENVGRVIPGDYYFWRGSRDCRHNWFRKVFDVYTGETYIFDLESPYED